MQQSLELMLKILAFEIRMYHLIILIIIRYGIPFICNKIKVINEKVAEKIGEDVAQDLSVTEEYKAIKEFFTDLYLVGIKGIAFLIKPFSWLLKVLLGKNKKKK